MKIYCENKYVISIAHNLVQYKHSKYVKVDGYFIKEKLKSQLICTPCIPTRRQLSGIFTKELNNPTFKNIMSKSRILNLYHQI